MTEGIKFLKERKEIAQAMNFGKYPVVWAHLALCAEKDSSGICGWDLGRVRFDLGRSVPVRGHLRIFRDDWMLYACSSPCVLSSRFGFSDIKEDALYANAPVIRPNSEFVLALGGTQDRAVVCIVKTGKNNGIGCSEPVEIRADMKRILYALHVAD
ncbi:MAG: hypothetical protein IJJ33_11430 [Victivallales bacterium]|nr:hypothetical protein [Victivallales bacterium]